MIPPEAILQASATMIIGILFIVTLAQVMRWKIAPAVFWFCLFVVIPFVIAAILALLELTEPAKWACIIGFVSFAFNLMLAILRFAIVEE